MRIVKFGGSLLKNTVEEIINAKKYEGVKWSRFTKLNEILKGFRGGEMTVLSGRSGIGKTTFLCEYCLDLCEQQVPTLFGSFEMSIQKICSMLLYQFSRLPLNKQSEEINLKWAEEFQQLPFYFIDKQGVVNSQKDLLNTMTAAVEAHGVRHIAIDNVQFLLGSEGSTFVEQFLRQDRLIQEIRRFSNETHCHCTLVVHPRKDDITRLLTINSLYGGGKIAQEADNVILIQDESTLPDVTYPKRFVQVVKNRYDGQLGRMDLAFNRSIKSFSTKVTVHEASRPKFPQTLVNEPG